MAKAILAGKKVKKLAAKYGFADCALLNAIIPRFSKNLFVRNRPGNAGNGDGQ